MSERRLIAEDAPGGVPAIILLSGRADESLAGLRAELDAMSAPHCRLAAFDAADWDADYTPWPFVTPDGRSFGGKADALLPWVEEAVTQLKSDGAPTVYLVGYSLGGLAALYFHTKLSTDGCASCSGSIWYPDFLDYLREHPAGGAVYFSIGGKEKNTRDPLMSANEDCTAQAYKLCQKSAERSTFAHEPGGHFKDTFGRMARGVAWLLREKR